jgi:hypothetical protein
MMAYRNFENEIPEPGTTISGFADSNNKKKKIMPTDPRFFFEMLS